MAISLEMLMAGIDSLRAELDTIKLQQALQTLDQSINEWSQRLYDQMESPLIGLDAAHRERELIREDVNFARSAIVNTIGTAKADLELRMDGLTNVSTPPGWYTAPTDYGAAPTASDNASGVWDYVLDEGWPAGVALRMAGAFAWNVNMAAALPTTWPPGFTIHGPWMHVDPNIGMALTMPSPDYTDIRPDDTVLSWLQRTDTALTWTEGANGIPYAQAGDESSYGHRFTITPDITSFPLTPTSTPPPTPTSAPIAAPVWPGLADVTMGTPQTLEDGAVIDGPLDGLILAVTSHPAGAGKFAFGDLHSWRYLGAIVFISDNGDAEWPQTIGPAFGMLTPKTMAHAGQAIVRLNPGFGGTVTPWTINGEGG